MKKSIGDSNLMKNIVSGALLLGGLAVGVIGAGIVAHANEAVSTDMQRTNRNAARTTDAVEQSHSEVVVPLNEIETEEDLINLVVENGSQVMIDEESGQMYVAYVNENNEIEVAEVTQEELGELINQVNAISYVEEQEVENERSYIPREYLRGVNQGEQEIENEGSYIPREYLRDINQEEQEVENEGSYIPREYLRDSKNQEQKKNRKKLNSKEGKDAVKKARQYKKGSK